MELELIEGSDKKKKYTKNSYQLFDSNARSLCSISCPKIRLPWLCSGFAVFVILVSIFGSLLYTLQTLQSLKMELRRMNSLPSRLNNVSAQKLVTSELEAGYKPSKNGVTAKPDTKFLQVANALSSIVDSLAETNEKIDALINYTDTNYKAMTPNSKALIESKLGNISRAVEYLRNLSEVRDVGENLEETIKKGFDSIHRRTDNYFTNFSEQLYLRNNQTDERLVKLQDTTSNALIEFSGELKNVSTNTFEVFHFIHGTLIDIHKILGQTPSFTSVKEEIKKGFDSMQRLTVNSFTNFTEQLQLVTNQTDERLVKGQDTTSKALIDLSGELINVNINTSEVIGSLESRMTESLRNISSKSSISFTFMKEALETLDSRLDSLTNLSVSEEKDIGNSKNLPISCSDVAGPANDSDISALPRNMTRPVVTLSNGMEVVCDVTTDGGGWLVFQSRSSADVDFFRNWVDYKYGFGKLSGNFWLGNEKIHQLTFNKRYELRVDLKFKGKNYFAEYSDFMLFGEKEKYALRVSGFSGDAGDALSGKNSAPFSTKDRENDWSTTEDCANKYKGAWWYTSCHHSNLNGQWGSKKYAQGLSWYPITGHGDTATFTEMKIREHNRA